jgi:hypothetical protein
VRVVTDHALGVVMVRSAAAAAPLPSGSSPPQELNKTLSNAQGNADLLNPVCIFIGSGQFFGGGKV